MPLRVSFHVGIEPLCAAHKVAVGLAPNLIGIIHGLGSGDYALNLFALLFQELQNQVVVLLILLDYLPHLRGHFQAEPLVLEVALQEPGENALHGFGSLELIFQVLVLLVLRKVAVELDNPHTVRSEQTLVIDRGKVIAGKPKRELREEGSRSFIKVPGLDFLTTGKLLDGFLVQLAILIALSHGHKPLTF